MALDPFEAIADGRGPCDPAGRVALAAALIGAYHARTGLPLAPVVRRAYARGDRVVVLFDAAAAEDGEAWAPGAYAWFVDMPVSRPVAQPVPEPAPGPAVSFGPFRLYPEQRLLERDGDPVSLGSRALDLLLLLVERAGQVVGKDELLARAWKGLTVQEGSLRFHVARLRRALGEGTQGARYVINVAGRGYCFVAPLERPPGGGAHNV